MTKLKTKNQKTMGRDPITTILPLYEQLGVIIKMNIDKGNTSIALQMFEEFLETADQSFYRCDDEETAILEETIGNICNKVLDKAVSKRDLVFLLKFPLLIESGLPRNAKEVSKRIRS